MENQAICPNLKKSLLLGVSNDLFTIIDSDDFGINKGSNYIAITLQDNLKNKISVYYTEIQKDPITPYKTNLIGFIQKENKKTVYEYGFVRNLIDFFKFPYK